MKKMVKRGITLGLCFGLLISQLSLGSAQAASTNPQIVNTTAAGVQGNYGSVMPSISSDGKFMVFETESNNLVKGDKNNTYDIFLKNLTTGELKAVSTNSSGALGNAASRNAVISANGRYVAFESTSTNLIANDANGPWSDVFVKDLVTGETKLVSASSSGVQSTGSSITPSISADGRYITFQSDCDKLVEGVTTSGNHIYIRDMVTGETKFVDLNDNGELANLAGNWNPSISGDGRYVAFLSESYNLAPNDTNFVADVYVRDVVAGKTVRVSVSSAGVPATWPSYNPAISADGRYVAFECLDHYLVPEDPIDYNTDVFIHDRDADGDGIFDEAGAIATSKPSQSSTGESGDGGSSDASFSADGRFLTYSSIASNLVAGDVNQKRDIFVYDLTAGTNTRVNLTSTGAEANDHSYYPVISGDGRLVLYSSVATNLVPSDTNGGASDIFMFTRW